MVIKKVTKFIVTPTYSVLRRLRIRYFWSLTLGSSLCKNLQILYYVVHSKYRYTFVFLLLCCFMGLYDKMYNYSFQPVYNLWRKFP